MHGSLWGNFRSPGALARLLIPTTIGLALDLLTKWWAFKSLALSVATAWDGSVKVASRAVTLIPGIVQLRVTANQGMVFGQAQGYRWFFVVVSIAAVVFLLFLFATSKGQKWYQLVLGLLLAGVLGNMYDRIIHGYVRDMIYALPGWRWPGGWQLPGGYPGAAREVFPWIFNMADSLLCVGVALLVIHSFCVWVAEGRKQPAAEQL